MPPKFPRPDSFDDEPSRPAAPKPRAKRTTILRGGRAASAAAATQEEPAATEAPPTLEATPARMDWGDSGLDNLPDASEFPTAVPNLTSLPDPGGPRPPPPAQRPASQARSQERFWRPTKTREQARADFERWLASLPLPSESLRGSSGTLPEASRWIPEFKRYLLALLAPIYPDVSTRREALSDGFVRVFMRAFTDISFSADDNETIEMLGDKILGLVFTQHVHSRVPSADDSALTHYLAYYMSKPQQAELATRMKIDQWILLGAQSAARRESTVTVSMKEDVLEAFFSSLYFVATQLHQDKLRARQYEEAALRAVSGVEAARILIDFIYDGIGLDPERGKDAAKTILVEIPKMYGLRGHGITFDPPTDGKAGAKHSVTISRILQRVLSDVGFKDIPLVLAKDFPDKNSAAEAALATLAKHGLNEQAIQDQKEITNIAKLTPESLRDAVIAKARRLGFPKQLFEIPERSKEPDGTMLVVLIGVNERDQRFTLASGTTNEFVNGRRQVAQLFLNSN